MNNNPEPGNKAGGLTTILEKSLGAVAKGGTTPLVDVYEYARPLTNAASSTWTRRGTIRSARRAGSLAAPISFASPPVAAQPGCKPSPSLKLATNNALWTRQEEDIDINCGDIVDSGVAITDKGREFSR